MMVGWILIVLLVILAVWVIMRVGLGAGRESIGGDDRAEAVLREAGDSLLRRSII